MGDNIKSPSHYCEGREYEPKDVIRDWGLNFNLGSCVKYISRAGRKGDKLEDLQKAKQFLEFEIEAVEEAERQRTKIRLMRTTKDDESFDAYCMGFDAGYDMAHTDLRSVEDTFTLSFKVKED